MSKKMDLEQVNDVMRLTYVKKLARKWSEIQGTKIEKFEDLCDDGQQEVVDMYNDFPLSEKREREIYGEKGSGARVRDNDKN